MKMKYSLTIDPVHRSGFPAATVTPLLSGALAALVLVTASGCKSANGAAPAQPPEILSVRQALPTELHQRIQPGQSPQRAEERTSPVGRYEKLELGVDLKATYQNPYDPDDLDLWAEFTAPSGKKWKIWGFYNRSSWSEQWMIRFAPTETGAWRYVVKVHDREGVAESKPGTFEAVESKHHGFINIAANRRYLQYADGSPFYGVGMWYNDGYELSLQGKITEAGLDNLREHGANLISFYSTPLETMGTGLGRYDQDRAARLDQIFEWCEQRDMAISWNIWFHAYFSEAVWGRGSARYRENPYRLITSADQFFSSDEAWRYNEKLLRYMVARWGYSRSLFLWFAVDEINGTEGWSKGGAQVSEQWCQRLHDWLKANDPYGRPTTGTRSGGIDQWWPDGYKIFDIAARELYEAQGHPMPHGGKVDWINENPLKFSYLNYAKQTQNLWNGFNKPAMIGECGADHTYYEPGTPGYLAMYHNALWVSLANGLTMSPLWWANGGPSIHDSVVTGTMLYFASFVGDIDFVNTSWQPVVLKVSTGDGWAMQSAAMTFGWVANPVSGVADETFTVPGLADGEYDVRLYRTWRGEYLAPMTATATGGMLSVKMPELLPKGSHAENIGDDVAFKIVRKGQALVLFTKPIAAAQNLPATSPPKN